MVRRDPGRGGEIGRRGVAEARDGEGSVEVLPDLGDYPIRDGPGVDPGDGAVGVAALGDDDGGTERGERLRLEAERRGRVVVCGGGAGEQAHQELVRRGAVEPPVEVRREQAVDAVDVARVQGLIQCADSGHAVSTLLQSFLRVSQFLKREREREIESVVFVFVWREREKPEGREAGNEMEGK